MKNRLTIYEIAKKSNVSIATVSRAMNQETRHKVAKETLKKIDAMVARSGYTPSLAARLLGGTSFKTIGMVVPHYEGLFFSDYYTSSLAGVADAILKTHYHFKLIMLKLGEPQWDRYNFRLGEGVDALVISHWPNFFSQASVIDKQGIPCAVIGDPEKGVKAHFSMGDNRMGGELAAKHLLSKGHKNVAVLLGPEWSSDSRQRFEGFQAYYRKNAGKHMIETLQGNYAEWHAAGVAENYLKSKPKTTAIFCCNDSMAIGVINKIKELGLQCPKDISVIGYDDDERSRWIEPALTTIRVPIYTVAKDATLKLVKRLKGEISEEEFIKPSILPVELVERDSVRSL